MQGVEPAGEAPVGAFGQSSSSRGWGPGTIPAIGSSSGFWARSSLRWTRRSSFCCCFSLRASSFFRFSKVLLLLFAIVAGMVSPHPANRQIPGVPGVLRGRISSCKAAPLARKRWKSLTSTRIPAGAARSGHVVSFPVSRVSTTAPTTSAAAARVLPLIVSSPTAQARPRAMTGLTKA